MKSAFTITGRTPVRRCKSVTVKAQRATPARVHALGRRASPLSMRANPAVVIGVPRPRGEHEGRRLLFALEPPQRLDACWECPS